MTLFSHCTRRCRDLLESFFSVRPLEQNWYGGLALLSFPSPRGVVFFPPFVARTTTRRFIPIFLSLQVVPALGGNGFGLLTWVRTIVTPLCRDRNKFYRKFFPSSFFFPCFGYFITLHAPPPFFSNSGFFVAAETIWALYGCI